MSTPRATQQGLGSATTLKERPSTINTGYLAEGIDRVAGEREKGLVRKAVQDETRRREINEALSQDSGVKLPYFQGQFKKGVEEYLVSDDFTNAKTYQVSNHISNLAKEQQAKEGLVNQKVIALTQGKKAFWNPDTKGHTDPATHIYSQFMDENGDIDFDEFLVSGDEGAEFISAPIKEVPAYMKKVLDNSVPFLKGENSEIKFTADGRPYVKTTEEITQEDVDAIKTAFKSNNNLIETYARQFRNIDPSYSLRGGNTPEQDEAFNQYVEDNLAFIKPTKNVKTSTPAAATRGSKDGKPLKEFETKKEVRKLGDGQTKEVVVAGVENKSNIEYGGKTVTIVSTTEDAEGNMVLVGQYKEGGDTEKVVIDPSQVKDQYTEDEWATITNTFDTKVSGKSEETFSVDVWMDEVSSGGSFQDEVAVKIKEQYPELNDIKDPLGKDDVAFTYKGKEYSFNVDKGKQGRKDLKELLNKIEKERRGETAPTQTETTIQTTKKPR